MPERPESADGIWPELEELEQRDDVAPTAVAVRIDESVKTHEMPARAGTMRTLTLGLVPELLVGRDLSRKSFHLHCYAPATGIFVGTDAQSVADGSAYFVGQFGSLDVTHCEQLWARSADPALSGTIAMMTEHWAD